MKKIKIDYVPVFGVFNERRTRKPGRGSVKETTDCAKIIEMKTISQHFYIEKKTTSIMFVKLQLDILTSRARVFTCLSQILESRKFYFTEFHQEVQTLILLIAGAG